MRKCKKVLAVFMCLFVLAIGTNVATASDIDKAPRVHKKNHKWLIPVMAAGGFAAGVFLGMGAFDGAINSEQKVWTTAVLLGAAGGVAGWWTARKIDQDFRAPGLGHVKPETRKPVPVIAQINQRSQKGPILSDIDHIYPSYLSHIPAPVTNQENKNQPVSFVAKSDYSVSASTLEAKKMAANVNSEYSVKNRISCSR